MRVQGIDIEGEKLAALLAWAVPLMAFIATGSGYGYWFDGGEFVAVATDFGVSHPPGHPVAAVLMGAATLLPLGSLAFRVSLLSAALAALAALFLFRAIDRTLGCLGVGWPSVRSPLALAGTWTVALSYGFWFQGVRPEVYALQAALMTFLLERLIAFEQRWPALDCRPLYAASFALGLGLANHHFLAFLVLPAGAPTLARVVAGKGWKPIVLAIAHVLAGLLAYIYLLLRGAADPYVNLGEPTSLSRLFWVVSAEAFQSKTGHFSPQPIGARVLDVVEQLFVTLHPATLALALGGAYVLLRARSSRRVGYVWVVVLVVFVAARSWIGFVRDNPDAMGYLMPALAAAGALAAAFAGALFLFLAGTDPERPRTVAVALAVGLALLSLLQLGNQGPRANLARFVATDAFDESLRRDLPARAVVLAHHPETVFRFWGGEAEEHLRPDVLLVPMPLLFYPGMVDSLVARAPELRELLRGYTLEGELRQPDLQSLAAERPLLVEMDPRVHPSLYETMVPGGLYHTVLADGATDADERDGAAVHRHALGRIEADVGATDDPATRSQLLWRHYMDALYYAGFGDREEARAAVAAGLALNPHAEELLALGEALGDPEGEGPLDVGPFMPR